MNDWTKYWTYSWLILGFIIWALIIFFAFRNVAGAVNRNPLYIPVLVGCADYSDGPYTCGAEFKKTLALYNYRVCKVSGYDGNKQAYCDKWYTSDELHFALNSLKGWKD